MTRNKHVLDLVRKNKLKRWLEKCETESYECAIMKEIAQKEAVNDVRAKADRWRYQQRL